jgi:hypothetical protein
MKHWNICLLGLWLLLIGPGAQAAATCSLSGTTSTPVYDPFSTSNNDSTQTVTVTCSAGPGDPKFPASFAITVTGTNGSRTLANGGDTVNFELHTTACAAPWQGGTAISVANINTGGGNRNFSISQNFCFRLPLGQNTTKAKPTPYTGTATLIMNWTDTGGTLHNDIGTLSMSATVSPACNITTAPGDLTINYTAFSPTASTGSSNFALRCTNTTPYTLALDATSGAVSGIGYTLALSAPGGGGTGTVQTYNINGTAAAGQPGTCAVGNCTASQARTLTIGY